MPSYTDQFFAMDPGNPPASGTSLTMQTLDIRDGTNDHYLDSSFKAHDEINGSRIADVWDGDTITVIDNSTGQQTSITGVTFYTWDGGRYFTPTDGTTLHDSTFVSSTWVNQSTGVPIGELGPPCFVAGTRVRTPRGMRPVESLRVGDMVLTSDRGAQPVRWIGTRTVRAAEAFAPILFKAGSFGNARELMVSPQHRMLVSGWRAELLFGQEEVLAAAKHLVDGVNVVQAPRREVTYVHILFDRHEIVDAEGVASESFHPGDYILSGDDELREEIVALFPELADLAGARNWGAARTVLKAREAQLLALAA